jgi:succinate dehydrogenase / fumarate reductase flavoprotein subunit
MAIGEAACVSVHGANRLGTNSLLDLIVFGRAAALRAAEIVKPGSRVPEANGRSEERAMQRFDRIRHSKGGDKPGEVRPQMQEVMQSGFAVFRRGDTLKEGLDKLQALRDPLERVTVDEDSLLWNVGWSRLWSLPTLRTRRSSLPTQPSPAPNHEERMRARITKSATTRIG